MRNLAILGVVGASLLVSEAAAADEVTRWNAIAVDVGRRLALGTNRATRGLAITHLAVHDAVQSVTRRYEPYRAYVTPPGPASLEAAVAKAAHDALVWLNPTDAGQLDHELDVSLSAIDDGPEKDNGIELGRLVAAGLVFSRLADGSANSGTYDLTIPPDPDGIVDPIPGAGLWRPTPRAPVNSVEPAGAPALEPHWRSVTTFGLTGATQFSVVVPPALTDQAYTDAYNEVKAIGVFSGSTRTPEQTEIAQFWRVGTEIPFNNIARTVAVREGLSLEENARLFALLNIALADSRIAISSVKYLRGYWRPITGIRLGDRDGNPATAGDATWRPLLETPAHPAYVSGHSGTGAAGAAVLAAIFGDATSFSLGSDTLTNVIRSFTSFSLAATENAHSRLYGGIHWRFDNEKGLELGQQIGAYVAEHSLLRASDGPGGAGGGAGIGGDAGSPASGAGGTSTTGGTSGEGQGGQGTAGEPSAGETGSGGTGTSGSGGRGGSTASGGTAGSASGADDGCNCAAAGKSGSNRAAWLLGLGLLLAARRRQRF